MEKSFKTYHSRDLLIVDRLQLALECAALGMWDWNLKTDSVFWSPECFEIHGLKEGEFGGTAAAFGKLVFPDDRDRVWATVRKAIETRIRYECEFRITRPDGSIRWVSNHGRALTDVTGEPVRVVGTIADITERKNAQFSLHESELRLSLALDSGHMGLWEWDVKASQSVWNAKEYQLLGLPVGDGHEPTDRFFSRVHSEDAMALKQGLDAVMKEGSEWCSECRIVRPDGEVRWLAAVGRVFRHANGQPQKMIGINYDITDRKNSEEQLREAHELLRDKAKHLEFLVNHRTAKLQDAMRELEAFSYSVAHDLRAPLRAMQGYAAELAHDTSLSESAADHVQKIERAAGRLDRLTREVLTYSKLSRDQTCLTDVDLDRVVHEIVDQYPEITCHKNCIHIKSPLLAVKAQESMLTQAISNLLVNACKFVEPGVQPEVTIHTIACRSSDSQADAVRICVTDKGIGIHPDHTHRLFKMFERIHPDYKYPGTGIGLAIVKKSAERMNGTVGFESTPNQGSTFWMSLPAAELKQK